VKKLAEFLSLRNWRHFCLYLHNHWPYGKTEDTGRFSASNWSKTNPPRYSDCSLLVLHKGMKMCGRNFLLSDSETLEMFWPTLQQPTKLWTNGGYGWIQQVRKVQK
jgi:hypothetical protein